MITRLLQCNDHHYHELKIEIHKTSQTIDIKNIKVYKKTKDTDAIWTECLLDHVHIENNFLHIILISQGYCQEIKISLNVQSNSSIRLQKKWIQLTNLTVEEKISATPIKNTKLNHKSPFSEIAQYLAQKYYWQPYPKQINSNPIKRHLHGATHAASATYIVDNAVGKDGLFIELLKKYLPFTYADLIRSLNDNKDLTEEDYPLIKCAVFCHDIANTSDGHFHDEKAHAEIFTKEMIALGFNPLLVTKHANAIIGKDAKSKKNLLQMLIHDADCLEVNRVLSHSIYFNCKELDIIKLLGQHIKDSALLAQAVFEINAIAKFYFKLMHHIYSNDKIHEACELSPTIYQHVSQLIQDYSFQQKKEKLKPLLESVESPRSLAQRTYTPIELYQENPSVEEIMPILFDNSSHESKTDTALNLYQTSGVYIRVINPAREFNILKQNREVLTKENITTSEQLKKYFTNQEQSALATLLPGFGFRPSTFIKSGLAITPFNAGTKILIDPHHADVLATHFYKSNANTNQISTHFLFKRPQRIKNKESLTNHTAKLYEKELRRRGEAWDNYDKNFGFPENPHNEVLLSYSIKSIIGIVINHQNIVEAIQLKQKIFAETKQWVPFYGYQNYGELIPLSNDLVVSLYLEKCETQFILEDLKSMHYKKENISMPKKDDTYSTFIPNLLAITCSLSQFAPSKDHPIRFECKDSKTQLTASFYMHQGLPIALLNGQRFFDQRHLITKLNENYHAELLQKCNLLMKEFRVLSYLEVDQCSLHLEWAYPQFSKRFLLLKLASTTEINITKFLKRLGYPLDQCKWEMQSTTHKRNYEVNVRLSVIQTLSAIYNKLLIPQSLSIQVQDKLFRR